MSFLNAVEKSTILITGGATGIGLSFTKRLLALGLVVIAVGRRQDVLDEAKTLNPQLQILQGDIGSDAGRIALFEKAIQQYPDINVLFNNAASLNMVPSYKATEQSDWEFNKQMIETNVNGMIHMSILFTPHLITKPHALIANTTSFLGFIPIAMVATYCATKAAQHSFTISLRHQLKDTSVKVVEIIPPQVKKRVGATEEEDKKIPGLNIDIYADDTIAQLLSGEKDEIFYHTHEHMIRGSREQQEAEFKKWNGI